MQKPIKIIIRKLTGNVFTLDVFESSKIEDIKIMIQEKDGTPPYQQMLIFEKKRLEEGSSLNEYNIQTDSTIHFILRLHSPPQFFVKMLTGKMFPLDYDPSERLERITKD